MATRAENLDNAHLLADVSRFRDGPTKLAYLGRKRVEVAAAVVVYSLFLIVGMYAQTASIFGEVRLELLAPSDGMRFQSSPVELAAIVTNEKGPLFNVSATIRVVSLTTGEGDELEASTNEDGIVRVLFPAQSGNYTWYVTTKTEGYPTIVSRPRSFSTSFSTLIVDCVRPCSSKSPVPLSNRYLNLQVWVTEANGTPVESANVTFYVNSMVAYSQLTDPQGIATVFWSEIPPGSYTWFAIASKDGEVGASRLSTFVVA